MKVKTSITITDSLLNQIDIILDHSGNRSSFIEQAIKYYIERKMKDNRDKKDLDIINNFSDELNDEADEFLSYQDIN